MPLNDRSRRATGSDVLGRGRESGRVRRRRPRASSGAALRLASLAVLVLALLVPAPHGARADDDTAAPASPNREVGQALAADRNNIMGINLTRRRQPPYLWAVSELANANGGAWGYVTVLWTEEDRDLPLAADVLQQFLDLCYAARLQPIVRLATRFDEQTGIWTRPDADDPLLWRAFLEQGRWPNHKVWVIPSNEPNLGREWGGAVDAAGFARYLDAFLRTFEGSDRFRVVNAPLDISNDTQMPRMQDAFEFLDAMQAEVPGIFERLPAWAANPYRAPSPVGGRRYTHLAYEAELDFIGRDLPVLITEAGYIHPPSDEAVAQFFVEAFRDWQADPRVIAATPLFWHPDHGGDWLFALDRQGRLERTSPTYDRLLTLPRVAGSPNYVPALENSPREVSVVLSEALPKPASAAWPVSSPVAVPNRRGERAERR